ncbi:hypothetical protein [Streptomyces sp. NPDC007110]|uniref:hypothetical protein n=1 Tax=Streptomyces sp. NPDC007110 TaxID=3156916 RepID=UPI0033DA9950
MSDEATSTSPLHEPARAAVIEIIELRRTTDDTPAGSVIVPNDIRINGQSLLSPRDCPVKIHEMALDDSSLVCVTLTLLARRVSIRAEGDTEAST